MKTLATWCVRHRVIVLLMWLAALIGMTVLSASVGTAFSNSFTLPNTESTQALNLLQSAAPSVAGDREQIVFHTTDGTKVTDPAVQSTVEAMLAKIQDVPHVTTVASPYGPRGQSRSARTAPPGSPRSPSTGRLRTSPRQRPSTSWPPPRPPPVPTCRWRWPVRWPKPPTGCPSVAPDWGSSWPASSCYLVFGSVFAMALPLLSALASLGTAIGLIGLLSHVLKMPQFSTELVLLIGLGVGVDYALFIVTRHRQGLIAGQDVESSIVTAVNTSGRAVMFAGIIVCIALLGMFALGVSFLYGLAIAASIGVLFTMIAALTLLPAFLGFIGPRVLSRSQKRNLAENGPRVVGAGTKGFWPRWAAFVQRRPVVPALCAFVVVVLVALPFFSLRLGSSDQGNDPVGTTTREGL